MRPITFIAFLLLIVNFTACGKSGSGSSSTAPAESDTTETTTPDTQTDPLKNIELLTPTGEVIKTSLAYTPKAHADGLQNVQPEEFSEQDGKLFFYLKESARTFWMPNTYFDLDIIYLDEDLKITDIVRDMEHYTGNVNSEIPRAPTITSRHVLEMKSTSEIADGLKVGDQLQWESQMTLQQTESEIRQQL